jgi:hypothetical protein
MFHVVLILMGLGFSAAIIAALLAPLWVGPLLQLLVTAFCKKRIYLLIPSIIGALLAVYSAIRLGKAVPPLYLAIYWCVYYLLLFAAFGIVRGIQSMFKKERSGRDGAAEKKG